MQTVDHAIRVPSEEVLWKYMNVSAADGPHIECDVGGMGDSLLRSKDEHLAL